MHRCEKRFAFFGVSSWFIKLVALRNDNEGLRKTRPQLLLTPVICGAEMMFDTTLRLCLVLITAGMWGETGPLVSAGDFTQPRQRTQRNVLNQLNHLIADIEHQRAAHWPAVAEKPRLTVQVKKEDLLRESEVLLPAAKKKRQAQRELAQFGPPPRAIAAEEVDVVTRPAPQSEAPRAVPESSDETNQTKAPKVNPESLEGILQRTQDVQAEIARLQNQPAPKPPEKSDLSIVLENPFLSQGRYRSNNEYDRAFAVRLLIANPTDKDLELKRTGVTLTVDQKPYKAESNTNNYSTSFSVGSKHYSVSSLKMPDVVKIPAGKSAQAWVTFGKLPMNPPVPDMQLTVEVGKDKREINVNEFCKGLLKTSIKRLGPKNCLAILTIAGELNPVNARTMVEELDELAINQKVAGRDSLGERRGTGRIQSDELAAAGRSPCRAGSSQQSKQQPNALPDCADGHSRIASGRTPSGQRQVFVKRFPVADS